MKGGLFLICIFLLPFFIKAQTENFNVSVDRTEIAVDEYLQVEFVLENGQGKAFTPPDFNGWTLINGPSTSTQVSIVNGVRSSSISYIYTLSPKKMGDLIIGKASIQVNGKTLQSDPVSIKVVKSKPNIAKGKLDAIGKNDIFILAQATPQKAYVGQQILMEYKLYTVINVENYNIAHAPDFSGFHVNNIPRLGYDNRETINGRTYVTKVIYAASIYPIQNGKFDIEPLHVRASIVTDESNNNSFFLLPVTESITLISNPVTIQVESLPQPAPPNFSGAVGKFKMASAIDQATVNVNDAVSLTLYVEGDGDLNRVGKPFLQVDSTAFQKYEPKITKENMDFKNSGFLGMREVIYPLVALAPGTHKITPTFIYFDTDSLRYVSLEDEVYNVNVSGAASSSRSGLPSSDLPKDEILPLIQHPKMGSGSWVGSTGYWGLLTLPYLLWIGVATRRYVRSRLDSKYSEQTQLNEAKNKALTDLHELMDTYSKGNTKSILNKIQLVLQSYLKTKWNIRSEVLNQQDWQQYIDQSSSTEHIKSNIHQIFKEAEMAVYAGQMPNAQILDLLEKAKQIIESV